MGQLHSLIKWILWLTVLYSTLTLRVYANTSQPNDHIVQVTRAFVELRTGPGRGYPVFHIIEKHQWLSLNKQRTDWIEVSIVQPPAEYVSAHPIKQQHIHITGWLHQSQLQDMQNTQGYALAPTPDFTEYTPNHPWFSSVVSGERANASMLGLIQGYRFNSLFSTEVSIKQAVGSASKSQSYALQLLHHSHWHHRYQPFVLLGFGAIRIEPNATLVLAEDRDDDFFKAGLGLHTHLIGPLFLRLEYSQFVILTSRNDNDYLTEWSIGLSSYF